MKLITALTLTFFLFPMLAATAYAETTSPSYGGYGNDFYTDEDSAFNSALNNATQIPKPVSDAQYTPLVEDLDNDGINEIITLGGSSISLFQATQTSTGVDVDTVAVYDMNQSIAGSYWSNMVLYDIDGDGNDEIIVYSVQNSYMYMISWNGSNISDDGLDYANTLFTAATPEDSSDVMIGCGDPDGCVMIYNDRSTASGAGNRQLQVVGFNSSHLNDTLKVKPIDHGNPAEPVCLPKLKDVPYINGVYYYTYMLSPASQYIGTASINSTLHTVWTQKENTETKQNIPASCGRGSVRWTSPTAVQLDGAGNYELAFGFKADATTFKQLICTSSLGTCTMYPTSLNPYADVISNVFTANAFTGSEDQSSSCIVGYSYTEGTITIHCVDLESSWSGVFDNAAFIDRSFAYSFNLTSTDIDVYALSARSMQSISDEDSISEVLTPYGVYTLQDISTTPVTDVSCRNVFGIRNCDATPEWNTVLDRPASYISVDVMEQSQEDLIALSDVNMIYIDDNFVNRNAYLGYCTEIKPSPDTLPWLLHVPDTTTTTLYNGTNYTHYTATLFSSIKGENFNNTYTETHSIDGVYHSTDEEPVTGQNRLRILYNFSGVDETQEGLRINITYIWSATPAADIIHVYIKNFTSGNFVNYFNLSNGVGVQTASYTFVNYTDFVDDATGVVTLNLTDTGEADAVTSDYLHIDAIFVSPFENGTVHSHVIASSTQTNEVQITAKPIDPEGLSEVAARAVLYYGETNQQDTGWSDNYSSGTQIPLHDIKELFPNKTTSGSVLRVYYKDVENYYDDPLYEDFDFRVQNTGYRFNDSSKCEGLSEDDFAAGVGDGEEGDACVDDDGCLDGFFCGDDSLCHSDQTNTANAANTMMGEFQKWTGLSAGLIALLIMGIVIYGLFMDRSNDTPPIVIFGGAIAVLVIGALVGVKMGWFGTGTVVILFFLGVVGGALVLGRLLIPSNSGGS